MLCKSTVHTFTRHRLEFQTPRSGNKEHGARNTKPGPGSPRSSQPKQQQAQSIKPRPRKPNPRLHQSHHESRLLKPLPPISQPPWHRLSRRCREPSPAHGNRRACQYSYARIAAHADVWRWLGGIGCPEAGRCEVC